MGQSSRKLTGYTTERVTFLTILEVLLTTWNWDYFVCFWPLPSNKNFYFLDYPDRPLADGRMVTLLYTLRNFNAERDNNTCM